jgi:hypothetical protein
MFFKELILISFIIYSFGVLIEAEVNPSRIKRQSDSTTEVCGLCLSEDATEGDYKNLKRAARSASRRGKRGLFDGISNPIGAASKPFQGALSTAQKTTGNAGQQISTGFRKTVDELAKQASKIPIVGELVTAMQKVFNAINFDFQLATKMKTIVEKDPVLNEMLVTSEKGVFCSDVCKPEGNGFGTIGICTGKYCVCDFEKKTFDLFYCSNSTLVFDTLAKKCSHPSQTILCSDEEENESEGALADKVDLRASPATTST